MLREEGDGERSEEGDGLRRSRREERDGFGGGDEGEGSCLLLVSLFGGERDLERELASSRREVCIPTGFDLMIG
jgi:hypothetical protein